MRDTVYFVSDAHFGLDADECVKVGYFRELAAEMRGRAAALYIVGDMFDFWIEYKRAIRSDYFLALHELRGLVEAGVEVHYLAGNHDFALGPFLEKTAGVSVHRGCVNVELQGRRLHISHGDRVNKSGIMRFVDRMLRDRFFQKLYRMIHPDIGVGIGVFFSALSKERSRSRTISVGDIRKYRRAARSIIEAQKGDLVIMAHTHHSDYVDWGDKGEYCNIGSWMDTYDYATLRDGKIQPQKWANNNL